MGIFRFFGRSNNKSREMIKLSKIYVDCMDKGNLSSFDDAIRNYYDFISKDELLSQYVAKHSLTSDDMIHYFHILLINGYVEHKGYLVPTYVFSFAKSMDYFLTEIKKGTPIYVIGYTIIQMI